MSEIVSQNLSDFLQPVISLFSTLRSQLHTTEAASQLKTIRTAPGECYDYCDNLSRDRSHSFAFQLDQMRRVSIDLANPRPFHLLGGWFASQSIEVILWNELGDRQSLFSVSPGDRDRQTLTLRPGRYLLELKTSTPQKIDYMLKLTAMKWLLLEYITG